MQKFKNPKNYKSELMIFNSFGQKIQKYQTTNNQLQINNNFSELYFFKLIINSQLVSNGKIIFTD